MNRRQFLFVAGTTLLARDTIAQAAPQIIYFGFSLYGMRSLALKEALQTCARIGYDAVELALMPGYHADPATLDAEARRRLRGQLQEYQLAVPALMENLPLSADDTAHQRQLDRLKAAADLGQALSPDERPVIETILGGVAGSWDKVRALFVRRLTDWARVAMEKQTTVCIKPHRLNAMNLPEQALWSLREVNSPWIKLTYDYSHFEHRDMTLAGTMKQLAPHTRFVHVKDTRVDGGKMQFLLPGAGQVDYVEYLRELKSTGYRGCVCVEVSGMVSNQKNYDAAQAARQCYERLAGAFAKAEVRRK
jgi:inosose dehydratase